MKFVLLHGPAWQPGDLAAALDDDDVERQADHRAAAGLVDDRPTVLLLDEHAAAARSGPAGVRAAADAGATVVALGAPGETDIPDDLPGGDVVAAFLTHPVGPPPAPHRRCATPSARPRRRIEVGPGAGGGGGALAARSPS